MIVKINLSIELNQVYYIQWWINPISKISTCLGQQGKEGVMYATYKQSYVVVADCHQSMHLENKQFYCTVLR